MVFGQFVCLQGFKSQRDEDSACIADLPAVRTYCEVTSQQQKTAGRDQHFEIPSDGSCDVFLRTEQKSTLSRFVKQMKVLGQPRGVRMCTWEITRKTISLQCLTMCAQYWQLN